MAPFNLFARSTRSAILLLGMAYAGHSSMAQSPPNLAAHAAGSISRYLYVANQTDAIVSSFTVDAVTGQLRATGYVEADIGEPTGIAATLNGRFVFSAMEYTDQVFRFKALNGSGVLSRHG